MTKYEKYCESIDSIRDACNVVPMIMLSPVIKFIEDRRDYILEAEKKDPHMLAGDEISSIQIKRSYHSLVDAVSRKTVSVSLSGRDGGTRYVLVDVHSKADLAMNMSSMRLRYKEAANKARSIRGFPVKDDPVMTFSGAIGEWGLVMGSINTDIMAESPQKEAISIMMDIAKKHLSSSCQKNIEDQTEAFLLMTVMIFYSSIMNLAGSEIAP